MHDNRVCPICEAIDGYTWTFEVGPGGMTNELVHPTFGIVWTTTMGSMAHGHKHGTCRCGITYELNLGDIISKLETLLKALESGEKATTDESG